MSNLIVPVRFAPAGFVRGGKVGELFGDNLPTLRVGLQKVVRESFTSHPVRNLTESEIKSRIDFCLGMAAELHSVREWAIERIVDEMPAALDAHLNGTTWEPSKRNCWGVKDQ